MSFSRIGSGSGKVVGDAVGNPWSVTGIPSTTAGHLLVCLFSANGASVNITSAADNTGTGTWGIVQSALSGGNNRAAVIYCLNCPAGVTSLNLTGTGGTPYAIASVDEFSYSGTCSLDQQNSNTGPSVPTALNTGSITNSATGGLNVIVCGSDDSNTTTWDAIQAGYTETHQEGDTNSHHASQAGFQVMSGTGPYSANFQYDVETLDAAAVIVSFKEVGGGTVIVGRDLRKGGPGVSPDKRQQFSRREFSQNSNNDVTVALTGIQLSFSQGSLTPVISGLTVGRSLRPGPGISPDYNQLFSAREFGHLTQSTANDVTVALTGIQISFSQGTLAPASLVPLVGQSGTFSAGTIGVSTSVPLVGQQILSSTGTLGPTITVALTGASVTSAQGTLVPVLTLGLTGSQITSATGTLVPSTQVSLTGGQVTFSVGTVQTSGGTPVTPTSFPMTGFICNVGTLTRRQ